MFISLRSKPVPFCFSQERPQNFLCILSSNIFCSQPKEAKKTTSSLLPCLFYLNENESSTKREAQDFEPPLFFSVPSLPCRFCWVFSHDQELETLLPQFQNSNPQFLKPGPFWVWFFKLQSSFLQISEPTKL